MKDKLFWIALIFAGFYLFNKMKSSNSNQEINTQTERHADQSPNNRIEPREIEPNFGDQNEPLNLPNKNGESQNQNTVPPINRTNNNEKDISLGEYGSVTLPKKNGQASSTSNQTQAQRTDNRSTNERMRVDLDRSTTAGSGTFRDDRDSHRLVREGEVVQVVSSNTATIYMVAGGFCTLTNSSNSTVYAEANSQLMLTGDGRNNTIYYERGAEIRNGLEDNRNNRFIEVGAIEFN